MREIKERQTRGVPSKGIDRADVHRFHSWSSTFWQWLRYCLVGAANTLIDVLILSVLLWRFPTNTVQTLVVYNSLAYTGGAASSFFLNRYWTFRLRQRPTSKEVSRFVISMFLELLSSNGLVWLIGVTLHPFLANALLWGNATKLLAVAGNAVLSYLIMRFWVFASESQKRPKQRAPSSPGHSAWGWKVLTLTWFSKEFLAKRVPHPGTICKDRQPEEDHAIEGEQPQSVDN